MELVAAPIILGLVQALKEAGLPSKYAGCVSVLIGVLAGSLLAYAQGEDIPRGLISGLVAGLTAAGLYSGSKALVRD